MGRSADDALPAQSNGEHTISNRSAKNKMSCATHFTVPYCNDSVVSGGTTGIVQLLPCRHVRKAPFPDDQATRRSSLRDLNREAEIYRRLPHQRGILRMIEYSPGHGLVLEFMEHGHLDGYLFVNGYCGPPKLPASYIFLHTHGVIHCDIKPRNFLLDPLLRLYIVDFAGSSLNGSDASSMPSARFCLPEHVDDDPSVQMDLFALGSTLYQIMTGRAPYADVSEEAVEERLVRHEFPSLLGIECGDAISKCWRGECLSALEIQDAIEDEIRSKRPSPLYDDVLEAFPGPGGIYM
ncbi:hypothetical protein LTS02_005480 [Friedmanniomyces endolithicus]|nr:hypothetical protein LTS02_005480 [Friedmanniomyces endolithicus]